MNRAMIVLVILGVCSLAQAGEQVLQEFSWVEVFPESRLELIRSEGVGVRQSIGFSPESDSDRTWGDVVEAFEAARAFEIDVVDMDEQGPCFFFDNGAFPVDDPTMVTGPTIVDLLTIDRPAISSEQYALVGMIRYEGVEPAAGLLRMWSHFPDGSQYFTETRASSGPLSSLRGTSDWRVFRLPFTNEPDGPSPVQLTVELELPGPGRAWIGPVRLVQEVPAPPAASPVLAESVGFSWRGEQVLKDRDYHQSCGIEVAVSEGDDAGLCLSLRVTVPPEATSYTEVDLLKYDPPRSFTGSLVGRYRYRGPTHSYLLVDIETADGQRQALHVMLQPLPGLSDAWHDFKIALPSDPASRPVKVYAVIADLSYGADVEFGPMLFTEMLSFRWPFPMPQAPIWSSQGAPVVERASSASEQSSTSRAWWSSRQAGLIGGIGGSVFGCLGALIGIVGGRGRARRFVLAMLWGMMACGALCLAGGAMALLCSQPYAVYYPLLLAGGMLAVISLVLIPVVKRRYAQIELRKMSAMDAG